MNHVSTTDYRDYHHQHVAFILRFSGWGSLWGSMTSNIWTWVSVGFSYLYLWSSRASFCYLEFYHVCISFFALAQTYIICDFPHNSPHRCNKIYLFFVPGSLFEFPCSWMYNVQLSDGIWTSNTFGPATHPVGIALAPDWSTNSFNSCLRDLFYRF